MDGNSVDNLLVPELGQGDPALSNPAPAEPETGQVVEPPVNPEPDGQATPATPPAEPDVVPREQFLALQRDYTKKAMELAQLKKAPTQEPSPQPAQTQYIPQQAPTTLEELIQLKIAEYVAPIQQQQQDLRVQAKIDELAKSKEFEDVAPAFIEKLEQNPELLDLENGIEIAYDAARADYFMKSMAARSQAAATASQQVTAQKIANNPPAPNAKGAVNFGSIETDADAIRQSILDVGKKSSIFG